MANYREELRNVYLASRPVFQSRVKSWLVGDFATLVQKFTGGGAAAVWGWHEVQWMVQILELGDLPCYVDRVDGYPGPNTHRALEYFQVKEELAITGLADDATLARLVQRYVELADTPVSANRVRTVGASRDCPAIPFGTALGPVFPDDAPQRLRRVEAIVHRGNLTPPESALAGDPAVYQQWCSHVVEVIDVSQPLPTVLALTDESGELLRQQSFTIEEMDSSGNTMAIAYDATDDEGVAQVALEEGRYGVSAGGTLHSTLDVSHDEFGGQMMVVLTAAGV